MAPAIAYQLFRQSFATCGCSMTPEWRWLKLAHKGANATLQAGGMAAPGMQGIGSGAAPPAGFPVPGGMGMAGMPGMISGSHALSMPALCSAHLYVIVTRRRATAICRLAAGARVWHAATRRVHRRHELGEPRRAGKPCMHTPTLYHVGAHTVIHENHDPERASLATVGPEVGKFVCFAARLCW